MADLEFLPGWYPKLRRKQRILVLQAWVGGLIVLGLALWMFLADRNERSARAALATLRSQVQQTDGEIQKMERLEGLRRQWRAQAESVARLGGHVESARILAKLQDILPPAMALEQMTVEREETAVQMSTVARAALKEGSPVPMDRRLKVKLQGVAPTDVELATFLTDLTKVPYFEQVSPTYARDLRQDNHILREFELTFSVNLNEAAALTSLPPAGPGGN